MNIRWKGMRWSLMLVKQPDWTSLSNSSTPGAYSTLLRGTGNNLVGHADLFRAGRVVAGIVGSTVVTTVATMKAAPYVKSRLDSRKAQRVEERADVVEETAENSAAADACDDEAPDVPDAPRPTPV
ncbi:hypothetical protein [Streptomyces sp. NPDC056512]|uniref:hypothetical protein n=1 Tax=Streptomyces sp. NPDC056512 TaxID=3345846 RepID=UPI00368472CE